MSWTIEDTCAGAVLCWLATAGEDGQPSVSPKEIWHRVGARLLIADIASGGSVRAIRANPKVCVSLLDIFRERGHKLLGTARIVAGDSPEFQALVAPLREKAGPDYPIRNVIEVSVERTLPILAPSWRLFPERDADDHVRATHTLYGVRPR